MIFCKNKSNKIITITILTRPEDFQILFKLERNYTDVMLSFFSRDKYFWNNAIGSHRT